jgi:hypothetical protein
MEKCRAGLLEAAKAEPGSRSVVLSSACADLYVEPGCRNAWVHAGHVDPAARINRLIVACRDAYCPKLSQPKPALCAMNLGPEANAATRQERWSHWPELQAAIFARDLGPDYATDLARIFAGLTNPISLNVPVNVTPEPSRDELGLIIELTADRMLVYSKTGKAGTREKPRLSAKRGGSGYDHAALKRTLAQIVAENWPRPGERPKATQSVIVKAAPSIAYEQFIQVIDDSRPYFSDAVIAAQ